MRLLSRAETVLISNTRAVRQIRHSDVTQISQTTASNELNAPCNEVVFLHLVLHYRGLHCLCFVLHYYGRHYLIYSLPNNDLGP